MSDKKHKRPSYEPRPYDTGPERAICDFLDLCERKPGTLGFKLPSQSPQVEQALLALNDSIGRGL